MDDINALRAELFAAMRAVREGTLEVEKAKVVSDLGQTIINSAKAEIDAAKTMNRAASSGFLQLEAPAEEELPKGIVSVRTHRMKG